MNSTELASAIEDFMHPVLYTGVEPLFIIAEELATEHSNGQIVEAVWIHIHNNDTFDYISKFAVKGKISLSKYYTEELRAPYRGRIALCNEKNLTHTLEHRSLTLEIKEFKSKRAGLMQLIRRDFDSLVELFSPEREVYLFKKKQGDWKEEFFSDFDIDAPYKLEALHQKDDATFMKLLGPRGESCQYPLEDDGFYGYFLGSKAEVAGLKLKSESYAQSIGSLQNDAKEEMLCIEWLELYDERVLQRVRDLPKHPFDDYFVYTPKEQLRKPDIDERLQQKFKAIVLEHMPHYKNPLGFEFIVIDELLYLFHQIIPREKALRALEECQVVYEREGILLGHGAERKIPPKYLVPIDQVVAAYMKFESFRDILNTL